MTYEDMIKQVQKMDFIKDEAMADATVKAVLGTLAGSMTEDSARQMTRNLPEPLTYEKLRSHQEHINFFTAGELIKHIADQFNLEMTQADQLIHTIIGLADEATGLTIEDMSWAALSGL